MLTVGLYSSEPGLMRVGGEAFQCRAQRGLV